MSDMHTTDIAKAKAEATFKRRQEQARDGAIAMAEYVAAQAATRATTERLKALRLAKEAADQQASETQPVKRAARAKKN
jgi:hypothetical protein